VARSSRSEWAPVAVWASGPSSGRSDVLSDINRRINCSDSEPID
jgi:hypothetical protein